MAKTIVEKIFSAKSGQDAHVGDIVDAQIDVILSNDASGPLSIDYFEKMGGDRVVHPERVVAIIDHYVPCPNSKVARLHQKLFDFRDLYGITLVEAGHGIAHQVIDELKYIGPGKLIIGGDSHTTTHGYLDNVSVGVGASDLAFALITGALWFKIPETIRINLNGTLRRGVGGKDVALYLLRILGPDGANYRALEFHGDGVGCLSIDDRRTICNLAAESSAKCAVMPLDERALAYCNAQNISVDDRFVPDVGCTYFNTIEIDLATVPPMISLPPRADLAVAIDEQLGTPIDMVVIGTCTNGRISDFEIIDEVIKEIPGPFMVETLIVPASLETYKHMVSHGIAGRLLEKGAMILPPGCGPCCGSSPGTPRDGFNVLSTANRNFVGRMGNVNSHIYLSSPAVAIASALTGHITDPWRGGHV